jgi:quinol-cytochrome oxidoreductase complex cytochrome b subunit
MLSVVPVLIILQLMVLKIAGKKKNKENPEDGTEKKKGKSKKKKSAEAESAEEEDAGEDEMSWDT